MHRTVREVVALWLSSLPWLFVESAHHGCHGSNGVLWEERLSRGGAISAWTEQKRTLASSLMRLLLCFAPDINPELLLLFDPRMRKTARHDR